MVPPSPHHFSGAGAATTTPHHAAGAWGNHKENAAPVGVTPGAKSYAATPSAKTNAESVAEVRPPARATRARPPRTDAGANAPCASTCWLLFCHAGMRPADASTCWTPRNKNSTTRIDQTRSFPDDPLPLVSPLLRAHSKTSASSA